MSCCCTDRLSAVRCTRSGSRAQGARYAALPVARRVGLVYVLSGLIASVAAIIYVAHLGQARSDAGTGYELDAITAVVLGGTSVFGGRGTIGGTLLGLFALAVLQTGLHLAAWPSELTGVLTGVLLLATIAADRHIRRRAHVRAAVEEEFEVKNSQVAILCATIVAGSLIVAGTNVWLLRAVGTGVANAPTDSAAPSAAPHRIVIAVMPKAKGRSLLRQLPGRRGRGGARARRRSRVGRTDQPRRREAERARRELDHAQGGRHCGGGREPRRHLHGAAQGARARYPRRDLGRRRRARRPRFLRQPGDGRRHRQRADRRGVAAAGRQRGVRDHHRRAQRREPERMDRASSGSGSRTSIPA